MSKNAKVLMMFTVVVLVLMVAVYFYRKNKNQTSAPALPSGTGASNAPVAPPADSAARYIRVTSY